MIMSPDQLIYELRKECEKLELRLTEAHQDIKDFEEAAIEWKKGYAEMEKSYKVKLANAKQTIEQLEEELDEAKSILRLKP
jgi:predicted RNase H-like nuclease (RuvC/YqgF family)